MADVFDDIHAGATGDDSDLGFSAAPPPDDDADLGFGTVSQAPRAVAAQSPQAASPSGIDYRNPAGAVGPLPSVPPPQPNMSPVDVLTGKPISAGQTVGAPITMAGPNGQTVSARVPDYGQNAIPDAAQGAREIITPGQRTQGATDILRGVNEGLGASILPLGVAPVELATGVAGSVAGSYAAPKAVKALGGNPQQQELARQAGAALPLAAGVGSSLLEGRVGGELPPAPRAPRVQDVEAPSEQLALPAPSDVTQHPAGRVTGIDQETGLPIVDRTLPPAQTRPQLEAGTPGANPVPQEPPPVYAPEAATRTQAIPLYPKPADLPSRPGFAVGPDGQAVATVAGELPASVDQYSIDSDRQHPVARVVGTDVNGQPIVQRIPGSDLSPVPVIGGVPQRQLPRGAIQLPAQTPPGSTDPESGRVVTQPTNSAPVNQALATSAMPAYRSGLQSAIQDIPGANLVATRAEKNPSRLAEKITEEGQPPETVNDYGAAQIAVDSPRARDAAIAAVQQQFPVLRVQDNFADGDPEYGYRSYSMQLQMPNGSSQELQIVPREVHDVNPEQHEDYKEARNAQLEGKNADSLVASARAKNDAAMAKFNARNGISGSIQKGSAVTLPDGTSGTVAYIHPGMKIARVTTDDGQSVMVRQSQLSPIAGSVPTAFAGAMIRSAAGDPAHQAAALRPYRENAAGATHEIIPASGRNPSAIRLSDDAAVLLDKIQNVSYLSNASTMDRARGDRVAARLRDIAKQGDHSPETRLQLESLAGAIVKQRTPAGNTILVRSGVDPARVARILREEFFHDWQIRHRLHSPEVSSSIRGYLRLLRGDAYGKAASALAGYSPAMIPLEIPAWIAAGDYSSLGLTLKEAGAILKTYLARVAAIKGESALDSLPEIDPTVAKEIGYEHRVGGRGGPGGVQEDGQQGSSSGPGEPEGADEGGSAHSLVLRDDREGTSFQNLADPVRDYVRRESELIRASREIHSGLDELDPQYDADVLRANRILQSLPGTPADQEQVYHHLEDPSVALTKTQGEILARLHPLESESAEIFHKLYPDRQYAQNYVHRIAQQKGSLLDRIVGGSRSTGRGNLLKKNAAAGKKRSMMALESPNGRRQVVSVGRGRVTAWRQGLPIDIGPLRAGMTNPEEILDERLEPLEREEAKLKTEQRLLNATKSRQAAAGRRIQNIANRLQEIEAERSAIEHQHIADNLPDKVWRDKDGNPWTFKQATTREIEHATPVEYYKNAAASVVTNWLELRRAARANDYLEDLKQSPDFQRLAIKPNNPGQIPDGWKSTQLPQFTGYYFEPHVAEVFDQYAKELAKGEPNVLEKVSSFLTTSIFLNPLAHVPNLTANWLAEKGISPLNVMRWGPEFKAGMKAFNAVVHQNHDFLEALDSGAPLQSQKREVHQFSQMLLERLQEEAQDPSVAEKLQSALGTAINVPALLQTAVNWMSSKFTWPVHDLYFLQSAFLKMEREGMTLPQALKDTATYIPDERLPTRVLNSKALGDLLRSPALMFTRYHYGVLKGWGKIIQNLTGAGFDEAEHNAKGQAVNPAGHTQNQERLRAASIAASLAIMLTVIYPEIDKLLAKATGNKDARLHRAGLATVGDAAIRVSDGEESPLQAARTMVTPSVLGETAADLATNRDVLYSGRKIYNEHGTGREIAQQVGTRLAESVSPAQLAMRASESPESFKQALYSLVGISFPRHGALRLAAQLRADHIPDDAETPGERKKAIMRSQARYLGWQGDMSGVRAARRSGLFTEKEMTRLLLETKQDPLLYEAKGLGIKDLLTLYESRATTAEDRQKLLPLIVHKAPGISKLPFAERDDLRKGLFATGVR